MDDLGVRLFLETPIYIIGKIFHFAHGISRHLNFDGTLVVDIPNGSANPALLPGPTWHSPGCVRCVFPHLEMFEGGQPAANLTREPFGSVLPFIYISGNLTGTLPVPCWLELCLVNQPPPVIYPPQETRLY